MQPQVNDIILVPTDFSEVCNNAISHAIDIAEDTGFKITLLHIASKKSDENAAESKLNEIIAQYSSKKNIKIDFLIKVESKVYSTISDVANEIGANYILLGTHGKKGLSQHLLGSHALKVVTGSKCPTIVIQKQSSGHGFKKIVFPVDLDSQTRQKLTWAVHIAQHFKSTIHLFPKYESDQLLRNRIMAITKQIKGVLEQNNVDFVDKVSNPKGGNFADQVIAYSKEVDANLIVIMTAEQSLVPMPSFLINPADEEVIFNNAQIPVMCINPREIGTTIVGM